MNLICLVVFTLFSATLAKRNPGVLLHGIGSQALVLEDRLHRFNPAKRSAAEIASSIHATEYTYLQNLISSELASTRISPLTPYARGVVSVLFNHLAELLKAYAQKAEQFDRNGFHALFAGEIEELYAPMVSLASVIEASVSGDCNFLEFLAKRADSFDSIYSKAATKYGLNGTRIEVRPCPTKEPEHFSISTPRSSTLSTTLIATSTYSSSGSSSLASSSFSDTSFTSPGSTSSTTPGYTTPVSSSPVSDVYTSTKYTKSHSRQSSSVDFTSTASIISSSATFDSIGSTSLVKPITSTITESISLAQKKTLASEPTNTTVSANLTTSYISPMVYNSSTTPIPLSSIGTKTSTGSLMSINSTLLTSEYPESTISTVSNAPAPARNEGHTRNATMIATSSGTYTTDGTHNSQVSGLTSILPNRNVTLTPIRSDISVSTPVPIRNDTLRTISQSSTFHSEQLSTQDRSPSFKIRTERCLVKPTGTEAAVTSVYTITS